MNTEFAISMSFDPDVDKENDINKFLKDHDYDSKTNTVLIDNERMEFCNFMTEDPSSYTVGHSIK